MEPSSLPGLSVTLAPRPPEPTPLRSDVAGFLGRTRRGPLGEPVRVEGLTEAEREFGPLDARFVTPYALRGYFENGGQVAHVIRVGSESTVRAQVPTRAQADWHIGDLDPFTRAWDPETQRWVPTWSDSSPASSRFTRTDYRIEASAPGEWANGTEVEIGFVADGAAGVRGERVPEAGEPRLQIRVSVPGEAVEVFSDVLPDQVQARLEASRFVRLEPTSAVVPLAASGPRGRRFANWTIRLERGTDPLPSLQDYLEALERLLEIPEVALTVVPDLYSDLQDRGGDRSEFLDRLLAGCALPLDRMAVLDVPPESSAAIQTVAWAGPSGRGAGPSGIPDDETIRRAGAVYHPWVRVRDPLGGVARPLREVPASGHVAGVISRLDRERGAHHSPANVSLLGAVDVAVPFDGDDQLALYGSGVNVLRCTAGRGVEVWGARTLDVGSGRFVAHRRLLHRLVRAIHGVVEPLLFDTNGPEVWFAITRGVTTVLLEAFRAGALQGGRPQEAFRVQCDEGNNPPERRDLGQVLCEIAFAPAAPMEFIRVTLILGQEGGVEVIER